MLNTTARQGQLAILCKQPFARQFLVPSVQGHQPLQAVILISAYSLPLPDCCGVIQAPYSLMKAVTARGSW